MELLSDENEIWLGNAPIELQGYEMTDYAGAISAQIAEEGTNIEQYMDAEDNPYLAAHVKSIRLSVEERDGELCGCATVIVDEDLTERGWNDLQDYITGQYSDGWGEGFEQTVEQVVNAPQQAKPSPSTKKYEITDTAHPVYPELHRIRALRQVREDVPVGTLGGFVQSEANLSQGNDEAWLYDDSVSRDEACVCDDARLYEQAMAQDLALARGSVIMYGNAIACDNAIVTGGRICNGALVCGNARVRENTVTHIAPVVAGHCVVMGDLAGKVVVSGSGSILPGQVVDNPTQNVVAIDEHGAVIVREPNLAPGRDSKNRNTPER